MGVVKEMEEGIYASPEILSKDSNADRDLGLTLLPGSQITEGVEKRLDSNAEFKLGERYNEDNGGKSPRSQTPPRKISESLGFNTPLHFNSEPGQRIEYAAPNSQSIQRSGLKSPAVRLRSLYSRVKREARLKPKPVVKSCHHCKPSIHFGPNSINEENEEQAYDDTNQELDARTRDLSQARKGRKIELLNRNSIKDSINNSRTRADLNKICIKHLSGFKHVGGKSPVVNDVAEDFLYHSVEMATNLARPNHPRNKTRPIILSEESGADDEDEDEDEDEVFNTEASTTHTFVRNSISNLDPDIARNYKRTINMRKMGSKHRQSKHCPYVRHSTNIRIHHFEEPNKSKFFRSLNVEGSSISNFLPNIDLASNSLKSKANYSELEKRKLLHKTFPISLRSKANYSKLEKKKPLYITSSALLSSPSTSNYHRFLHYREAATPKSTFTSKVFLHTSRSSPSLHSIYKSQAIERIRPEFTETLTSPSITLPSNHSHRKRSASLPDSRTITLRTIMNSSCNTLYPLNPFSTEPLPASANMGSYNTPYSSNSFGAEPLPASTNMGSYNNSYPLNSVTPQQMPPSTNMGSCNNSYQFNSFAPQQLPVSTNSGSIARQGLDSFTPQQPPASTNSDLIVRNTHHGQVAITEDINPSMHLNQYHNMSPGDVLSFAPRLPRIRQEHLNTPMNHAHKATLVELARMQPVLANAQRLLHDLSGKYQDMKSCYDDLGKTNNELSSDSILKSEQLLQAAEKLEMEKSVFYHQSKDILSKAKMWEATANRNQVKVEQLQALLQQGVPKLASAENIVEKITGVSPEKQANATEAPVTSLAMLIDLTAEEETEVAPKLFENEPHSQGQTKEPVAERSIESKRARLEWMGDQNPLRILKRPRLDGAGGISNFYDNPPAFGTLMSNGAGQAVTISESNAKARGRAKKSKVERAKPGPKRSNGKKKSSKQAEEVLQEEAREEAPEEAEQGAAEEALSSQLTTSSENLDAAGERGASIEDEDALAAELEAAFAAELEAELAKDGE